MVDTTYKNGDLGDYVVPILHGYTLFAFAAIGNPSSLKHPSYQATLDRLNLAVNLRQVLVGIVVETKL
jgi:hypothetical protein